MKRRGSVLVRAIATLMAITSAVPFVVLLRIALSTPAGSSTGRALAVPEFQVANFSRAWELSHMGAAILNSVVITVGALVTLVACAAAAGYAIARFPGRFHLAVMNVFLFSMMIPGIINTVPLYTLMRRIGGINSRWAMALVLAANALPFSAFLYANFIRTMSKEIEESAIVDGCTWFAAFWRITFPLLKPVTAAVVIVNGLGIWNNYAQAVFFLQKPAVRTIPLAVSMFFQQYGAKWNLMAAAAAIGVAPAVAVFILFQKQFIKGLAAGALKG